DGVVLAPPGEDLERALQLRDAADEGVELALTSALGEVDAVGAERVARGGRALLARPALRRLAFARFSGSGHLRDPVRDVVEDVQPAHALAGQEVHGVGASLG